ncbi:MAG: hypothetical protein ABIH41_06735 [Nanoarchaeota archaeon]
MLAGLEWGAWVVVVFRLLVPLLMFRFPLWGGVAAFVADSIDVLLTKLIGHGELVNYILLDKILDSFALAIMVLVSFRWGRMVWVTSLVLFGWRLIGVVLIAPDPFARQGLLLVFPALIGFFYLFCAARERYFPSFVFTPKSLAVVLLVLLVPKLMQEAILHNAYVQSWPWLRTTVLIPLGIVPG